MATWLDSVGEFTSFRDASLKWGNIYLHAFYFSCVTMVTVGYGDITPESNVELMISVASMLISCGVFAYSVNQIGNIINEMNFNTRKLTETL